MKKLCESLITAAIKCYSIFNVSVLRGRKTHKETSCLKEEQILKGLGPLNESELSRSVSPERQVCTSCQATRAEASRGPRAGKMPQSRQANRRF